MPQWLRNVVQLTCPPRRTLQQAYRDLDLLLYSEGVGPKERLGRHSRRSEQLSRSSDPPSLPAREPDVDLHANTSGVSLPPASGFAFRLKVVYCEQR